MKLHSTIISLLDRLLPPDLHHLIGDMEEQYHFTLQREGRLRAELEFWPTLFKSVPWLILQSFIWNTEMLFNYLKVTWRNFKKNTGVSLVNIFGLAGSMAVCLLIILFIADQKSYDQFHGKKNRIVRVITDSKISQESNSNWYATTPGTLGDIIGEKYPEVEQVIHVRRNFDGEFRHNDKILPLHGFYADSAFLSVFSFELLEGNPATALSSPGSVLLTPESAQKFFGEKNPVGQVLTGLGDRDYLVTGVIDDNVKTHFMFEAIASYATLTNDSASVASIENWRNTGTFYTYLLMRQYSDLDAFEAKIQSLIETHFTDTEGGIRFLSFKVQPLTGIALGAPLSNEIGLIIPGFIGWFLTGFAIVITLIATFNYVSLTIARSLNRGKEVGVRKVLGAFRWSVVKQFLFESVLIALVALFFGNLILQWLLPQFNNLFFITFTGKQVSSSLLLNGNVILTFLGFSLLVGFFAGIYPSLYLSSFNPATVLKGTSLTKKISGQTLKKILTVSQFAFSIVFIITSVILFRQFKFMINTDYGFDSENVINIALQDIPYSTVEQKLLQSTNVKSVAASSKVPAIGSINGIWVTSDSVEETLSAHSFVVNEHYIQTMELNLVAGRNFDPEMSSDLTTSVIISDQAAVKLGLGTPSEALTKEVIIDDSRYTVVGVIENFISADLMRAGDPIVMFYNPERTYYAIVKTQPGKTLEFIGELDKTWLTFNSLYSLKYKIFNDQLEDSPQLGIFADFIKILGLLGVFSIFISCLGLLGMAMYSAEQRVKEVGIRKVLGASSGNIVFLLSKEYLILVVIAIVISLPLTWLINTLWMTVVTNKIDLEPVVFIVSIFGVLLLSGLTISSQAIKAARSNSIDNLRSE